jgi:hypothetical protein
MAQDDLLLAEKGFLPEGQVPLRLRLPNLQVGGFKPPQPARWPSRFEAEVRNVGLIDAGPFDVRARVEFEQESGRGRVGPAALVMTERCERGVPVGESRWAQFDPGQVGHSVPVAAIVVCADPPTPERPFGEVMETNNSDNCRREWAGTQEERPEVVPDEDEESTSSQAARLR